jgi:NAD(P)H dehydrogenase (quinone)
VPYVSADSREEILEQYRDYLQRLDTLEPLAFPSLADFDRQLQPLNNRERVPA